MMETIVLTEDTKENIRSYRERFISLEKRKKTISEEMADLKREMKNTGIDVKAFSKAIKDLERDVRDVDEEQDMIKLYKDCLSS